MGFVYLTFTSMEHNREIGLHYYHAAHYEPALGQFLTADPAGRFAGIKYRQGSVLVSTNERLKYRAAH